MSDLATVLDPARAAHASLHGYLYQAYLGVERWLDLGEKEVLRCEGDEDLDRLLRDGSGGWSEQVKALSGGVTTQVVQKTLRQFAVSHHRLRTADPPETRRFLFTTTATRSVDILKVWEQAKKDEMVREGLVEDLRKLLRMAKPEDGQRRVVVFWEQLQEALAWLDSGHWADLIDSIEWRLGEPQLTEVRARIKGKLNGLPAPVPPGLEHRLLSEILDASIEKEPRDRCRTLKDLQKILRGAGREVAKWLKTSDGQNLVERLRDLDDLRGVLFDKPLDLPASPRPGQLLTAAYEVIPFDETGREEILEDLARWCADARPRLVRLIHGDGGLGKTRLLIEWCRRLAAQGWLAGFLLPVATQDELPRLLQGTLPRLVVIDYAETRLEAVRALVTRLAYLKDGPKVRLVLLTRREGDWWQTLKADAATEQLLDSTRPQELPRLLPDLEERRKAFQSAAHAFAQHLPQKTGNEGAVEQGVVVPPPLGGRAVGSGGGQEGGFSTLRPEGHRPTRDAAAEEGRRLSPPQNSPPPDLPRSLPRPRPGGEAPPPEPDLTEDAFGRPLYLHMAALAAAQGYPVTRAEEALAKTLERERRYWRTEVEAHWKDPADRREILSGLERSVTILTLLGGLSEPDRLTELAQRVLPSGARVVTAEELAERVRELYVAPAGTSRHVGGLEPDLLGEELVWEVLRRSAPILRLALDFADSESSKQLLTVLTRLAQRPERAAEAENWLKDAFEAKLDDLAEPALEVAVGQGDPVGKLLAKVIQEGAALELARRIMNRCDKKDLQLSVPLREVALNSTQRVYDQLQKLREENAFEAAADKARGELSRVALHLGVRLGALGRHEEALRVTQEAAELNRLLAQQRPDAFARSLNNLSAQFSALGRREEALQAVQEAVEIRRVLVQQHPDAFRPALATSLNNLGLRLSDLGRREEALQASQEAVDLHRLLAHKRPEAFRPELAMSLNSLGSMLSDLGRRDEALQATQEAANLYRLLAEHRPDAFRPYLAGSLNNLGVLLSTFGRRDEALQASQEAADLYRLLAEHRPGAFRPDLATSLNNLGLRLSALGRREEALQATREAVEIRRLLAEHRPDAFGPDLVQSLGSLSNRLHDLDRDDEALAAAEEGARLLAPFFIRYSRAFEGVMRALVRDYIRFCQATSREPDPELLAPIEAALAALQEDSTPEP